VVVYVGKVLGGDQFFAMAIASQRNATSKQSGSQRCQRHFTSTQRGAEGVALDGVNGSLRVSRGLRNYPFSLWFSRINRHTNTTQAWHDLVDLRTEKIHKIDCRRITKCAVIDIDPILLYSHHS
jgi:hypothetical protein